MSESVGSNLNDPKGGASASAQTETFTGRMLRALNDGALCLMVSLGHRSGLFDSMRGQPAANSVEIARRAGLDERYVREWLGAMATGGVVEVDETSTRYRLPDEHAAILCRAAAADNLAPFTQYLAILGAVEDDVLRCFRQGGGVPYERFPRFHAVMAEDSGQSVLSSLESHILPLVAGLRERLEAGIDGLDLGCGAGRIVIRLAELFPRSRFTGLDLSAEAVDEARRLAAEKRLPNVEFRVQDLSDFDLRATPASCDLVTTFDAVHDQAQPRRLLAGIHRALRDDGIYVMQDIKGSGQVARDREHPIGTFLYTISCMHCMTVSLAQGGEGLGAMWGEQRARAYLQAAGFGSVELHELAHDIQNYWYVVRKRQ